MSNQIQASLTFEQRRVLQVVRSKCVMSSIVYKAYAEFMTYAYTWLNRIIVILLLVTTSDSIVVIINRVWVKFLPNTNVIGMDIDDFIEFIGGILAIILLIVRYFENPKHFAESAEAGREKAKAFDELSARIRDKMRVNGLPVMAYTAIINKINTSYTNIASTPLSTDKLNTASIDLEKNEHISALSRISGFVMKRVLKRITTIPPEISSMTISDSPDMDQRVRAKFIEIIDRIRGSKKELRNINVV